MRHRLAHRKLNRTSAHRKALHRNLAQSLIEHGQIRTTLVKAKDVRPFVEKIITLAIAVRSRKSSGDPAASLSARRQIHKMMGDRSIVPADHRSEYADMGNAHRKQALRMASGRRYRTGEPKGRLAFTGESVTHRLIESVAVRYEDRPGGYTRIIHLADRRVGDHSALAILQLVGDEDAPGSLTKPARSARRRRVEARYRAAAKAGRASSSDAATPTKEREIAPDEPADPPQVSEASGGDAQADTD